MKIKTIKTIKTNIINNEYKLPAHWIKGWLLHCIKKSDIFLITDDGYELTDNEYQKLIDGIQKMQSGTPLAYLLGVQGFFGLEFLVDEHTLIPRPDSEVLIEKVLDYIQKTHLKTGTILDLGTGSGCLALTLAKHLPTFEIIAVDYSVGALEIAKKNSQRLAIHNCTFIHSNWYEYIKDTFDIIISNPPYIAKDDSHLNELIKEPITALVADNNGLADIELIISQSVQYLNRNGLLVIEHGYNQSQAVQALFAQAGFYHIVTQKDYGGNDRITFGIYHNF